MLEALQSSGAGVSTLGDGETPISHEQFAEAARTVASQTSGPVTAFAMAHGDVKGTEHKVDLDGSYGTSSAALFDTLHTSFRSRPVDVFMTACYGGAAVAEVDRLPPGSQLAILSTEREVAMAQYVDRLPPHIDTGNLSSRRLLNQYLGNALKNRLPPSIATSGGKTRNLHAETIAKLGKPFSAEEAARAHQHLDSVMGKQRVTEMMSKIAGARHEYSINAVDFGPALAIVHEALRPTQSLSPEGGRKLTATNPAVLPQVTESSSRAAQTQAGRAPRGYMSGAKSAILRGATVAEAASYKTITGKLYPINNAADLEELRQYAQQHKIPKY